MHTFSPDIYIKKKKKPQPQFQNPVISYIQPKKQKQAPLPFIVSSNYHKHQSFPQNPKHKNPITRIPPLTNHPVQQHHHQRPSPLATQPKINSSSIFLHHIIYLPHNPIQVVTYPRSTPSALHSYGGQGTIASSSFQFPPRHTSTINSYHELNPH